MLELTRLCWTTELVNSGIRLNDTQPCPVCGDDDPEVLIGQIELFSDRTRGQAFIFACCFAVCHGQPVPLDEYCTVCDECDDCCACPVCPGYMGSHKVDTDRSGMCSNCDGCEEHCECFHCDRCGEAQSDSTCGRCDRCDSCCSCVTCERCERKVEYTNTIGSDTEYCDSCTSDYCSYCDECELYYFDEDGGHNHNCECQAPHMKFEFLANGDGTVAQDERLHVELPKGSISDAGMYSIAEKVRYAIWPHGYDDVPHDHKALWWSLSNEIENEVGHEWQAKRGNFTRRLSSFLYKRGGYKLSSEIVSEIGNMARAHAGSTSEWDVEFTRDLNQDARYFYHGGSCWWGGYSDSRCALKSWGGLAMRSFTNREHYGEQVAGRVWVQPLNKDLQPTHDTINAHAFVAYNGYGDLDGYAAARILAHLTGRTYRKIDFDAEHQYINAGGYLIADEATCAATNSIDLYSDIHHKHDAFSLRRAA